MFLYISVDLQATKNDAFFSYVVVANERNDKEKIFLPSSTTNVSGSRCPEPKESTDLRLEYRRDTRFKDFLLAMFMKKRILHDEK